MPISTKISSCKKYLIGLSYLRKYISYGINFRVSLAYTIFTNVSSFTVHKFLISNQTT